MTSTKFILGAYSLLVSWSLYAAGLLYRVLTRRPRRLGPIDRSRIRSIALIRLDEMGDFAIFTAMLRPLREAFPDAHITLVMCDWVCPLAQLCPYIDDIVPFPTRGPKWKQFLLGPIRALRIAGKFERRFDLVINPRFDRDVRGAAFLAHFTMAPWILGYPSSTEPFKAIANRGYDRLYTQLLPAPVNPRHESEFSLAVLEFLGIPCPRIKPELWISAADRRQAQDLLRQEGWRPGDHFICLGIGASQSCRRWPMESFRQLAERLVSTQDARFLIVGGQADREAGERLRPFLESRLINLAGRTPLRVSAAALNECSLYVGNDSGPKHLAAALGKPVVEIICHPQDGDPTHFLSPQRFRALIDPNIVLAPATGLAPCKKACLSDEAHCITQVSVDQVLESVALMGHPLGWGRRFRLVGR